MDKKHSGKISIVIPAYNEEDNIPILMARIDSMFKETAIDGEVIFVNDGSTDATGGQIKECLSRYPYVSSITHAYNMGLTRSLSDGFSESSGDIMIFFPADLQYLPEDIPMLLSGFEKGYDVVTGWKQGHYNKRFISSVYNYLSRKLFHIDVHDLNSIKAMKREVMASLILSYDWHRYIAVLAKSLGFKVGEVKVKVYPRKFGKSKFGPFSILIGIIDLIIVKVYTVFSKKPALLFGLLSSLSLFSGMVILAAVYICFLISKSFLLGISLKSWLLLVAILIISGILFFLFGFIVELITHLEIRVQKLSEYVKKKK
jgi:glycosyltransferase involved in cell wall biosynthesis